MKVPRPLLRLDDSIAGQQFNGLSNGDAGDAELGGQRLISRQPQALCPYYARNPLPKDAGDLRVFWNVAVGDQIHLALAHISDSEPAAKPKHAVMT
jgi:hypothetical protein